MASSPRHLPWPDGPGRLSVHDPERMGPRRHLFGMCAPHTRLEDGRTVVFEPALKSPVGAWVIDAEANSTIVPTLVSRRLRARDPAGQLREWTRLEATSKIVGIPVLVLLTRARSEDCDLDLLTAVLSDIVLTVGRKRPNSYP